MAATYYEYGMERLTSGIEAASQPQTPDGRLARFGALLTIVLDRIAYAEYGLDEMLEEDYRNCAIIGRICGERAGGGSAYGQPLDELARLREEYVTYLELLEDNDRYRYGELHALGERYFTRLVRIGEIVRGLPDGEADWPNWRASVELLAETYRGAGNMLETMALRQFYGAVRGKRYVPLASVCLVSDFFRTTGRLIQLFALADETRPETIEARKDVLSRTYALGPLVSFGGAGFDFRLFDDETSPLMPDVVDMLGLGDYEDEGGETRGC